MSLIRISKFLPENDVGLDAYIETELDGVLMAL